MRKLLLAGLLAFQMGTACAAAFEALETQLIATETESKASLLDLGKPLYRCGEIVRLADDRQQLAVVWNYQFNGRVWRYELRKAHR